MRTLERLPGSDSASALFDIDLANAFLLPNFFDFVANHVCQAEVARDRFHNDERRRCIRCIELDVLYSAKPIKKRLASLDVFDPVKFERVSHFTQNTLGGF